MFGPFINLILNKKIVIVNLKGGLGNQMFQYAFAKEFNCPIYFDFSTLEIFNDDKSNFTARKYELTVFGKIKKMEINALFKRFILSKTPYNLYLSKVLNIRLQIVKNNKDLIIGNVLYLNGFFQKFHFENVNLFDLFSINQHKLKKKNQTLLLEIQSVNSVCVHIRRGDYLKPEIIKYHGVLEISYYQKAIEIIVNTVNNPKFYFFSEDIQFITDNFSNLKNYQVEFISNKDEEPWVDLFLMSNCKHQIIANSTYSWWSATLNSNVNKIVIAPKAWYAEESLNKQTDELIPPNWLRI